VQPVVEEEASLSLLEYQRRRVESQGQPLWRHRDQTVFKKKVSLESGLHWGASLNR
jgi:hypothetical protein